MIGSGGDGLHSAFCFQKEKEIIMNCVESINVLRKVVRWKGFYTTTVTVTTNHAIFFFLCRFLPSTFFGLRPSQSIGTVIMLRFLELLIEETVMIRLRKRDGLVNSCG